MWAQQNNELHAELTFETTEHCYGIIPYGPSVDYDFKFKVATAALSAGKNIPGVGFIAAIAENAVIAGKSQQRPLVRVLAQT